MSYICHVCALCICVCVINNNNNDEHQHPGMKYHTPHSLRRAASKRVNCGVTDVKLRIRKVLNGTTTSYICGDGAGNGKEVEIDGEGTLIGLSAVDTGLSSGDDATYTLEVTKANGNDDFYVNERVGYLQEALN